MKKNLELKKFFTETIDITYSKQNNQLILLQKLKYEPKKCEDCDRHCQFRRVVNSFVSYQAKPPQWIHRCNYCRLYFNTKTGKFNTSWNGLCIRQKLKK